MTAHLNLVLRSKSTAGEKLPPTLPFLPFSTIFSLPIYCLCSCIHLISFLVDKGCRYFFFFFHLFFLIFFVLCFLPSRSLRHSLFSVSSLDGGDGSWGRKCLTKQNNRRELHNFRNTGSNDIRHQFAFFCFCLFFPSLSDFFDGEKASERAGK